MKKLWEKDYEVLKEIEAFTVGKDRELDIVLAPFDVFGSLAHVQMLEKIGLISNEEKEALTQELKKIYRLIEAGDFKIDPAVEDIHSQIELMLTKELGGVGKKIHTGRSRNDQVLLDLKLYFRNEIENITNEVKGLFDTLIQLSNQHKEVLMPGYTHMQVAMVSSFGLWFAAYAETFIDDLTVLQGVYKAINKNPLGSAAGYGSSFPLDRQMVTDLLGFDTLNYNVIHAQMGRGKAETFLAFGISAIAGTLSKLAMDICLYMNQNHGFFKFPDELTTGSSIMPHKKNPDVFELIRGRCNTLQTLPQQVQQLCTNLPTGYHRDYQLLKELVFPAIEELKACLSIAQFSIGKIEINPNILEDDKYRYLYTVEEVNKLVNEGVPFRDAYQIVGKQTEMGTFSFDGAIEHTHLGSLGNLANEQIKDKMEQVLNSFSFGRVKKALTPFQLPLP
jgi:argininosuccinate lyase